MSGSLDSQAITQLIQAALDGDRDAEERVCNLLVDELRAIARGILEGDQGTVQGTELVNQAWARLFRGQALPKFPRREAFLSYMSRAMRHLLIDHLRSRKKSVDGAGLERRVLDNLVEDFERQGQVELADLTEALDRLRQQNERQFRTVECRFFGAMTMVEIAAAHGVSVTTVENDWRIARARLRRYLSDPNNDTDGKNA